MEGRVPCRRPDHAKWCAHGGLRHQAGWLGGRVLAWGRQTLGSQKTQAFGTHVGPIYRPIDGDGLTFGFFTDERHANKRGVTHGGMLATAFDIALGNASWEAAKQQPAPRYN